MQINIDKQLKYLSLHICYQTQQPLIDTPTTLFNLVQLALMDLGAEADLEDQQLENLEADLSQQDYEEELVVEEEQEQPEQVEGVKRRRSKKTTDKIELLEEQSQDSMENSQDIYDDNFIIDRLPDDKNKLTSLLLEVKQKLKQYKTSYLREQDSVKNSKSYVGDNAVPICADVTKFDFDSFIKKQLEVADREFDVIMMDPPWRLSTSQPSRGVAIQYSSLGDEAIQQIPVQTLQKRGFLFIWVINAKFQWTVNVMEKKWGYKVVDSINWVKKTVNGKIAKGHGFYLQHAKQTCLVGFKGDFDKYNKNMASDVIFSFRRGQSQKPTEIYQYIERLVPNGYYLEIFGRRNNLRNNWVTIGNEL